MYFVVTCFSFPFTDSASVWPIFESLYRTEFLNHSDSEWARPIREICPPQILISVLHIIFMVMSCGRMIQKRVISEEVFTQFAIMRGGGQHLLPHHRMTGSIPTKEFLKCKRIHPPFIWLIPWFRVDESMTYQYWFKNTRETKVT